MVQWRLLKISDHKSVRVQVIRCEVPHRPVSLWPLMRHELAIFASVAIWQSLRAMSICWPFPVLIRPNRAAKTEFEVYKPVVRSVTATPTFTGGPSLVPVICIRPISLKYVRARLESRASQCTNASTMTSYPARLL